MRNPNACLYPDDLKQAEAALLEQRREGLRSRLSTEELEAMKRRHDEGKLVGLALSGGGMRSATFSLGFLQSLANAKVLRQIDFLSTVSGGSYIGGFLGALFDRRKRNTKSGSGEEGASTAAAGKAPSSSGVPETVPMWDVEAELTNPRSKVVAWLRENGRYLSPAGASDGWAALAVILRNLVAVHMVLWTSVLTIFVALNAFRGWLLTMIDLPQVQGVLDRASGSGAIWWSPSLLLPALIFPVVLFPLGIAYWLVPDSKRNEPKRRPGGGLYRYIALVTNGLLSLAGMGLIVGARAGHIPDAALTIGIAIVGETLLAFVALLCAGIARRSRSRLSRWLTTWLIVFFILLVAGLVDSLGQTAYFAAMDRGARNKLVASLIGGIGGLMALSGVARNVFGLLGTDRKAGHVGVPVRALALVGATVLLLPVLVGLSAIGHGIVWGWQLPQPVAVAANADSAAMAPAAPKPPTQFELDATGRIHINPPKATLQRGALRDPDVSCFWTWLTVLGGGALCWLFGKTYSFLNNSSIASLYSARLTRAYLGASNQERVDDGQGRATTEMLESDFVDFRRYSPHENGGPLHIINMTLNETVGGRSQIEERDRKGMNFALGPAGISVAARHHALWIDAAMNPARSTPRDHLRASSLAPEDNGAPADGFEVFPTRDAKGRRALFWPEMLDLGRLIAISGAAASTALGSMTSLGLSLLCGLLNVRLGHWWWSGVDPRLRGKTQSAPGRLRALALGLSRHFPVQSHLMHEFLARFPGTASRSWYLTDGGHFENTAVYELIRRRLKVIIVLDNGADPTTKLEDIAGLVRKARVDFETEIEFEDAPPKGGKPIGSLAGLGFTVAAEAAAEVTSYAALARIRYPDGSSGKLLLVKPGVIGRDEPIDVLNYRALNPAFPQQTTVDQFFDEAQWEAHRRLGTFIGNKLFDGTEGRGLLADLLG